MANRHYDITLTIGPVNSGSGSGSASSTLQSANLVSSFSVKCGANSIWTWALLDQDGFLIATSVGTSGPLTGPTVVVVNQWCVGFIFYLTFATPDTYNIRVNGT